MAGEYCKYILSKGHGYTDTSFITDGHTNSKVEFYQSLNKTLDLRKQEIKIDEKFDPDYFLFDVISVFFTKEKVFAGYMAEKLMQDKSKEYQDKLKAIRKKWEDNGKTKYSSMYDELFEIFTHFMIIMENVRRCLEDDVNQEITFRTATVDIDRLVEMMDIHKNHKEKGKKKIVIPSPVDLFNSITKHKKENDKDVDILYFYFFFIMHATYTRNEELKQEAGYGW